MNPSVRAKLARSILREIDRLPSVEEADIIYHCFGLRTPQRNGYGDRDEPFILADAPDDALLGMAEHLSIELDIGNVGFSPPDCWARSDFRVFISHVSSKKEAATGISREISIFGFDGFVAHEDIEPTKEWAIEIRAALRTCDVLVALISPGFRESKWCDQEVGAAVGRGVPIFSFYYDNEPHGFAGMYQGVRVAGKKSDSLIEQMVQQFIKNPATSRQASRGIARAIRHSRSYAQSNRLASLLPHMTWLGENEAALLREAMRDNSQVAKATQAGEIISETLRRLGHPVSDTAEPVIDSDDIPF